MISREQFQSAQRQAREYLSRAGIVITPEESTNIEVADFGLNELDSTGLELVVYVNTDRVCAKELVLFPRQTCPQHYHPRSPANRARKRPSAAAGERSTCMYLVQPHRIPRRARQKGANRPTMSGTRLSCGQASSTLSRRIRHTGSRLAIRARSCLSSPPGAATSRIFSPILKSSARRRSPINPV